MSPGPWGEEEGCRGNREGTVAQESPLEKSCKCQAKEVEENDSGEPSLDGASGPPAKPSRCLPGGAATDLSPTRRQLRGLLIIRSQTGPGTHRTSSSPLN